MNKLNKSQKTNYLAIKFLEKLGNSKPTQCQINLMEALITQHNIKKGKQYHGNNAASF